MKMKAKSRVAQRKPRIASQPPEARREMLGIHSSWQLSEGCQHLNLGETINFRGLSHPVCSVLLGQH